MSFVVPWPLLGPLESPLEEAENMLEGTDHIDEFALDEVLVEEEGLIRGTIYGKRT